MGNHIDFQRGVTDYQSGKERAEDQSQAYNNGFDIARVESEHQLYENESQRGQKL